MPAIRLRPLHFLHKTLAIEHSHTLPHQQTIADIATAFLLERHPPSVRRYTERHTMPGAMPQRQGQP